MMNLSQQRLEWGSDQLLISVSAPLLLHFTSVFVLTSSKCQTNLKELISISMIIIILIIKVDYNYHENYPRIL